MNAEAVIQGFIAGLTILCIIGATLLCKMMKKGTEKVKEIKQARDEELSKVDFIVENLSCIDVQPPKGKAEYINFYLGQDNESAFYAVSPEHIKRLRPKLEQITHTFEQTKDSYGHNYAERRFYIGDKLIFRWKNEVKI